MSPFTQFKTAITIPPTLKSGTMTGSQSIITGSLAALAGVVFLTYEILSKPPRSQGGASKPKTTLTACHVSHLDDIGYIA
jgi:hypothetical protein